MESHPEYQPLLEVAQRLYLKAVPWSGEAYRTVGPKYARPADIISGIGAAKAGGRWNPVAAFAAVYLSTTPQTATAETFAGNRYYSIPFYEALPRVLVAVDVDLPRVLDMTDPRVRRALGLSITRLFSIDWRAEQNAGREALTQALGRAAFAAGFDGLLVPSDADRRAKGVNLVVIPANLGAGSRLAVLNPDELKGLGRS